MDVESRNGDASYHDYTSYSGSCGLDARPTRNAEQDSQSALLPLDKRWSDSKNMCP